MLEAGVRDDGAEKGTVLVVLRGGDARLSTGHGEMVPRRLEQVDDTLDLTDLDLEES